MLLWLIIALILAWAFCQFEATFSRLPSVGVLLWRERQRIEAQAIANNSKQQPEKDRQPEKKQNTRKEKGKKCLAKLETEIEAAEQKEAEQEAEKEAERQKQEAEEEAERQKQEAEEEAERQKQEAEEEAERQKQEAEEEAERQKRKSQKDAKRKRQRERQKEEKEAERKKQEEQKEAERKEKEAKKAKKKKSRKQRQREKKKKEAERQRQETAKLKGKEVVQENSDIESENSDLESENSDLKYGLSYGGGMTEGASSSSNWRPCYGSGSAGSVDHFPGSARALPPISAPRNAVNSEFSLFSRPLFATTTPPSPVVSPEVKLPDNLYSSPEQSELESDHEPVSTADGHSSVDPTKLQEDTQPSAPIDKTLWPNHSLRSQILAYNGRRACFSALKVPMGSAACVIL